jgi:hypothetical protein
MRIYQFPDSDVMILDSLVSLNQLHDQLTKFLASDLPDLRLTADVQGSAAPYDSLLAGLSLEKADGSIHVSITNDGWLEISGGVENLIVYVDVFRFTPDEKGAHHHPECVDRPNYMHASAQPVIVEADTQHIVDLANAF